MPKQAATWLSAHHPCSEGTASEILKALAASVGETEADWTDVETNELWRRTTLCIVGIGEATRISADRRQPWTSDSTWHLMVKHAELKQSSAKAATMSDSNRLVKAAARADWLTWLEEAMKEATAADGVRDSRRMHQIVKRVSGNKETPASLVGKDLTVWVEHFRQLLGTFTQRRPHRTT